MGCTTTKSSKTKDSIEKMGQESIQFLNSSKQDILKSVQNKVVNIPNQILCEDDFSNQMELHICGRNLQYSENIKDGDIFIRVYEKKGYKLN